MNIDFLLNVRKMKQIDETEERWCEIEDFSNYEISTYGNIRNRKTGHILCPNKAGDGYLKVTLRKNGKSYTRKNHRLVAEHFLENPDELPVVDHINCDRCNNNINNLRWVSYQRNCYNLSTYESRISDKYKGAVFHIQDGKWHARIREGKGYTLIGRYRTEEEAGKVAEEARKIAGIEE